MKVYEAQSYQDFICHCLEHGSGKREAGTKKSLAEHLKCHATFISHVLAGKAHFSNEQAVRFCDYYALEECETDFFIDLLGRDRAGDTTTRKLFERRIESRRIEWMRLSSRVKGEDQLSGEQERLYFENWLLQLVHLACMLPDARDDSTIAAVLGLPQKRIDDALKKLVEMGLVENSGEGYRTLSKRLHLDRSSPTFRNFHAHWRLRIVQDVADDADPEGIHYTSAMAITADTARKIKKAVLEHIESTRELASDSKPRKLYMLATDFYSLSE